MMMRRLLTIAATVLCLTAWADKPTVMVMDLQNLDATVAAAMLAGGTSELDISAPLARTARDFALDAVQQVAQLPTPRRETQLPTYGVANGRALATHTQNLSHLLPDGLTGPPVVAPNRNALIVSGTMEALDDFRGILALLDVPAPMVKVALRLDEVGDSLMRSIAPEMHTWGVAADTNLGGPGFGDSMLSWGLPNMSALGRFGRTTGGSKSMTEAQVTTISGQPALIAVGEVRPWFSAIAFYDRWGRRHVEYVPHAAFTGVTFWVLPQVLGNNTVRMRISADFSKVAGPAPDIRAGDVTVHRMIETTVVVADGQPLVIGGLARALDDVTARWPGDTNLRRSDSDAIITVTPSIIHTLER